MDKEQQKIAEGRERALNGARAYLKSKGLTSLKLNMMMPSIFTAGSTAEMAAFEKETGIGVNYFFTRNVGIGVDATWLYAKEASDTDGVEGDHTTIHNFTGSLIFRLPMDESCLAPYFFVGGGFHVDGEQWASAHAGVGIEYRIVPQKVGLFADGRWTYLGDRFGNDDLNFFSTRLGVRFVF